jgi:hypothetical protein
LNQDERGNNKSSKAGLAFLPVKRVGCRGGDEVTTLLPALHFLCFIVGDSFADGGEVERWIDPEQGFAFVVWLKNSPLDHPCIFFELFSSCFRVIAEHAVDHGIIGFRILTGRTIFGVVGGIAHVEKNRHGVRF